MTKPRSNRLGMYADIRQILDAALSSGGGSYECGEHGKAVHWRQRAYKFRKLYAELLGDDAESVYDTVVMPRVAEDGSTVSIQIRKQVGVFVPNEGVATDFVMTDPLFDIAGELAAKIDKGEV